MDDKRIMMIGTGIAAILLIGGWLWLDRGDGDRFAACRSSVIAGGASEIGGPFELISETGEKVTDKQVFSKPSLLYFGYTFCPDVCPLDNSRNAEATDLLDEKGVDVQPVFISVDPKRDTTKVMSDFTESMHEKMLGLTGTPKDLAAVAKSWRVSYQVPDVEGDDYMVSHTTMTYLVMPEYGTVEFFGRDVSATEMADRVACFVEASS
ncbi:MAG: SCO family protein [Paracoccus sp. (in: a-proteobacteria)]